LLITSGLVAQQAALAISNAAQSDIGLLDIYRTKPLDLAKVAQAIREYSTILLIEEQSPIAGLYSLLCEVIVAHSLNIKLHRLGPPDKAIFEYGTRDYLFKKYQIDAQSIKEEIATLQRC
jgi:transketolase C-terminal domain/subunit